MVLTEFNKELHEKYLKEDAWEEGLEEGRAEGRAEGISKALYAMVNALYSVTKNKQQIYELVISSELYKDITMEQVENILKDM